MNRTFFYAEIVVYINITTRNSELKYIMIGHHHYAQIYTKKHNKT